MTASLPPDDPYRPPPCDLDAEAAVLGSMVLDNSTIPSVRARLLPLDFYSESHQRIYSAVLGLVDAGIGVVTITLRDELRRRGDLEIVGDTDVLMGLLDRVPSAAHAQHYAEIVARFARRRWVIALATRAEAAARAGDDFAAVVVDLSNLTSHLGGVGLGGKLLEESGADAAGAVMPEGGLPSLPVLGRPNFIVWGWSHLLAGYPRSGKTELLVRLIRKWLDAGHRVLYFTEEPQSIWIARLKGLKGDWSGLQLVYAIGADPAQLRARAESGEEEIVVLDTLRNLLRLHDETNNSEIAEVVNPWVALCRRRNKTLIMLHHARKGGGEHGEGIAGGHALLGSFDIGIELLRVPNSPNRRHLRAHARLVDPGELVYERAADGAFRALGDPSDLRRDELKVRLLDLLGVEWRTTKEVREALPQEARPSEEALRLALVSLAGEEEIERDPSITVKGVAGKRVRWRRQPTSNPPPPKVGGEVRDDGSGGGASVPPSDLPGTDPLGFLPDASDDDRDLLSDLR